MQLYALEGNTCIIAQEALAHKDYRCPECAGIVRARHGPHRRPHFYHMHLSKFCRQRQKSEEHIQTQLFLKKCLPQEEAALEKIYPAIGRIADVAWEREKLVFEIQCSPISAEEVKSRTTDYRSLG
ncbi:MAG: competence protein CoiA, partial [Anaerolineae bacterium]